MSCRFSASWCCTLTPKLGSFPGSLTHLGQELSLERFLSPPCCLEGSSLRISLRLGPSFVLVDRSSCPRRQRHFCPLIIDYTLALPGVLPSSLFTFGLSLIYFIICAPPRRRSLGPCPHSHTRRDREAFHRPLFSLLPPPYSLSLSLAPSLPPTLATPRPGPPTHDHPPHPGPANGSRLTYTYFPARFLFPILFFFHLFRSTCISFFSPKSHSRQEKKKNCASCRCRCPYPHPPPLPWPLVCRR